MDRHNFLDPDWRRSEVIRFGRKMLTTCDPCPICGAMVCGNNQKDNHTTFHQAINNTRNRLNDLTDRVTALETRVTAIETRLPPI